MLSRNDFSPVTLEDRPLFVSHYQRFPAVHSDNTFTNMVCWDQYAHYRFAHVRDSIIISSTIDGRTKFRPPIGPDDPELLEALIVHCLQEGDDAPLVLVDAEARARIEQQYPDLPLYPDRNYFEYVYRAEDLALLPGRQYLNIRRHLNRFRKNCNPVVEEIGEDNQGQVEEFLREWCEWKNCDGEPFLAYEKEAVQCAISHLQELGLSGLLIRVLGRVGAISVFEPLNDTTMVVHFEKGLPDCEGIYKAINAETAERVKDRFEFINRESDMGVSGLREAKLRYHPHHMVEVFYATRDDLDVLI
jgi:hypothetical protein